MRAYQARNTAQMQRSFSDLEYTQKKKVTRRDRFLAEIDSVTPWSALVSELQPYYPEGKRGRPPIGLERMLRMYVAQHCFGLSDEGIEDAIYDSQAIRRFVGIDLSRESAPDATTVLGFRRRLETDNLAERIFGVINGYLSDKRLMLKEGTIVDATLIAAPPSTKNKEKARDPEMHQTKKGNQWYFGMKAHIGVDAASGLVHSLSCTAANVTDVTETHELLQGEEKEVYADAGYQGVDKREEHQHRNVDWHVAMKRGKRKALGESAEDQLREKMEQVKASVRAKVEHPFHVLKNRFRHRKTRYRGLEKNQSQLYCLFGFANLVIAGKALRSVNGISASIG